jgi:signal transduction histidine kinase
MHLTHLDLGTKSASGSLVDNDHHSLVEQFRGRRNRYFLESTRKVPPLAVAGGMIAHIVLLGCLWHADYPTWRVVGAAAVWSSFVILQFAVVSRIRDADAVDSAFKMVNSVAQLMIATIVMLTGGLHSPAAPGLVLPSMIALLFFKPSAPSCSRLFVTATVFLIALLPESIVGPALPHWHYVLALSGIITVNLHAIHMVASQVANAGQQAIRDIDQEREERIVAAEAQSRRLQSVAARVAHELKNPLASIKGLCQLVARSPSNDRTTERLAVAESEIVRMQHILTEYLSFSRPLEDLSPAPVDCVALANNVVDVLSGRADNAGIGLSVSGDSVVIEGDARRIKEAMINLLANAIDATPRDGAVTMRIRSVELGAEIDISDTGRGISPEHLAKIGTSYFTTRAEGTGLGVVIATSAISQHGGTLRYRSKVGSGTTASIFLPHKASALATTEATS